MADPARRERGIIRALKRRLRRRPTSKKLRKSLARHRAILKRLRPPLRVRAYREAKRLIGIMEQGGNNRGPAVERIIKANAGYVGEPWCGDFVAYCYRRAGSRRVTRSWAAVRFLRGLLGIHVTRHPKRGDLVTFRFSHVGIFVRHVRPGLIETIEGNTGASGAVSDSATGGDGVYRKLRETSLVEDYLRVRG